MLITFLFSLWGCYMGPVWTTRIWTNPFGTHVEPHCTPNMGSPYGTHIGRLAGTDGNMFNNTFIKIIFFRDRYSN